MSRVVLDASAMLAFLRGEAGADVVGGYLGDALASAVSLAETAAPACTWPPAATCP